MGLLVVVKQLEGESEFGAGAEEGGGAEEIDVDVDDTIDVEV